MASDLISRKALMEEFDKTEKALEDTFCQPGWGTAKICVKTFPTVDAAPVVHGKWIDNGVPESVLSKCSVCGYSCGSSSFNFCPNCGAKMDGGDEE